MLGDGKKESLNILQCSGEDYGLQEKTNFGVIFHNYAK